MRLIVDLTAEVRVSHESWPKHAHTVVRNRKKEEGEKSTYAHNVCVSVCVCVIKVMKCSFWPWTSMFITTNKLNTLVERISLCCGFKYSTFDVCVFDVLKTWLNFFFLYFCHRTMFTLFLFLMINYFRSKLCAEVSHTLNMILEDFPPHFCKINCCGSKLTVALQNWWLRFCCFSVGRKVFENCGEISTFRMLFSYTWIMNAIYRLGQECLQRQRIFAHTLKSRPYLKL